MRREFSGSIVEIKVAGSGEKEIKRLQIGSAKREGSEWEGVSRPVKDCADQETSDRATLIP